MTNYKITTRDNQVILVEATKHLNAEVAQWGLRAVLLHAADKVSAGNVATIELDYKGKTETYDLTNGGLDGISPIVTLVAKDPRRIFAAMIANRNNQFVGA